MRLFNTTGKCIPSAHYMVNIDRQVEAAAKLVRQGNYFCINRGRQFGKTTTLSVLQSKLEKEGYVVFSISFEGMNDSTYSSLDSILFKSIQKFNDCIQWNEVQNLSEPSKKLLQELEMNCNGTIDDTVYSRVFSKICESEKIVLLIDEVDQAGNSPTFIQFLGLLREMFLKRDKRPTFQSIILASVYDVKNLKLKMRSDEEHQYNSPWNIAVPFDVNMSLPSDGIAEMLNEYRSDRNLNFDVQSVGRIIFNYTSGYPFLVSRICQIIDESKYTWDKEGILKAVNHLLMERNVLFDDIVKKINEFPELKQTLMRVLYSGVKYPYSPYEKYLQLGVMFSFLTVENGIVKIYCRLIETMLYTLFISEEKQSIIYNKGQSDKNQFVHDGYIDMRYLLERFSIHFNDIFRTNDGNMYQEFVEKEGRKQFLLYLRPIINGIGNYYIESETRDETRTDIIIDYLGHQYVIELKIWHGEAYNKRGEQQLVEYLDYYHLHTGYMVSFCFNKTKQPGVKETYFGSKKLIEAIV